MGLNADFAKTQFLPSKELIPDYGPVGCVVYTYSFIPNGILVWMVPWYPPMLHSSIG